MDSRLLEASLTRLLDASLTGNVGSLHELLQENPVILRHTITLTSFSDNPLHIPSLLGHVEFARVVMQHNSELAQEHNLQGYCAIHLASAKGHLQIVKDFLNFDTKLGVLKDQQGRTSLHIAAIRGKFHVLEELLSSCPDSAKERTPKGESVLHLTVKHNQFEASVPVVHLIQQLKLENDIFNLKDEDGYTILHHATERKQCKMVEFLLKETNVEVNAANSEGFTALDIAIGHPMIYSKDKDIEELLRGAGGTESRNHSRRGGGEITPGEREVHLRIDNGEVEQRSMIRNNSNSSSRSSNSSSRSSRSRTLPREDMELIESLKNGIMILAVMFATLSFEVALNPPSGVWQEWDENTSPNITAAAVAGIADSGNFIPPILLPQFAKKWNIPNVTSANAHRPGKAINREYAKKDFLLFMSYNASVFFSSLTLITMIAMTGTFDFDKYLKFPILTATISLIIFAAALFRTGMTLVTDKRVSDWATQGAVFYQFYYWLLVIFFVSGCHQCGKCCHKYC